MIKTQNLHLFAAVLLMVLTIASFIIMAVSARYLSDELDTFEIMMYRSLVSFVLVLMISDITKKLHTIRVGYWRYHFFRNIFHFSAQNLWIYTITAIPLVQVFALEFAYSNLDFGPFSNLPGRSIQPPKSNR